MLIEIEVDARLEWRASYRETSRRWVGICEAMNLATEADSLDELHSVINETINLILLDLLEDNEFERYLHDRGWRSPQLPGDGGRRDVRFHVPWQLIAEGARDPARRAH